MFSFIYKTVHFLAIAAGGGGGESGFTKFYNDWLNIPGFEAWKFINLAIFLALLVYLVKKPLGDAFKAKRDEIRAELIRAEEEKQAALKQLTSAEAKLGGLDNEKATVLKQANEEAEAERRRLAEQTESDIAKLKEQAGGEIARLQKQTLAALRRFSADESIRLAEAKLRAEIDTARDTQLVKNGIASIGGLNHK